MEAPAIVHLGPDQAPDIIWHALLSLEWRVLRIAEDWAAADYVAVLGTPGELRRFRVVVSGPLPGRPEETGQFVMVLRQVGDRPGWWVGPESPA